MNMLKQILSDASQPAPKPPPAEPITFKGVPIVFEPNLGDDEVVAVPADSIELLLADLAERGISIIQVDGALKYKPADAMTPELRRRILVAMEAAGCPNQAPAPEPEFLEEVDPPSPCIECGSFDLWESPDRDSVSGYQWRCQHCDPPRKAEGWFRKAERLRRAKR